MIVGVLADTHIPRRAHSLPVKAYQYLEGVDAIVHAGDVVSMELIDELRKIAPVYAVLGNNDHALPLPERLDLSWEGIDIGVIHDSGARTGRAARLRRWFPTAEVVIFGHSHIPINEPWGRLLLFNPGSPTDRRWQPYHTMGRLRLENGEVNGEILVVD